MRLEGENKKLTKKKLRTLIHGLDVLKRDDAKAVVDELKSKETPHWLVPLDVTDPGFCKSAIVMRRVSGPSRLNATLLPFQEEGLGWMLDQEAGDVKGGILADEMGMGKTIQMISFVTCKQGVSGWCSRADACRRSKFCDDAMGPGDC